MAPRYSALLSSTRQSRSSSSGKRYRVRGCSPGMCLTSRQGLDLTSLFIIAMLKTRDSSESSRLIEATESSFSEGVLTLWRCTFDLRRSILNLSIMNGLISSSLLGPKYCKIDLRRPSSHFQLRLFASAQGRNVSSTNSLSVGEGFPHDPYLPLWISRITAASACSACTLFRAVLRAPR